MKQKRHGLTKNDQNYWTERNLLKLQFLRDTSQTNESNLKSVSSRRETRKNVKGEGRRISEEKRNTDFELNDENWNSEEA
jgi:hypothetical protein